MKKITIYLVILLILSLLVVCNNISCNEISSSISGEISNETSDILSDVSTFDANSEMDFSAIDVSNDTSYEMPYYDVEPEYGRIYNSEDINEIIDFILSYKNSEPHHENVDLLINQIKEDNYLLLPQYKNRNIEFDSDNDIDGISLLECYASVYIINRYYYLFKIDGYELYIYISFVDEKHEALINTQGFDALYVELHKISKLYSDYNEQDWNSNKQYSAGEQINIEIDNNEIKAWKLISRFGSTDYIFVYDSKIITVSSFNKDQATNDEMIQNIDIKKVVLE